MKILLALFADDIIDQDIEQYDIIGARHAIHSEQYPTHKKLQLVLQFRAEPIDADATRLVQICLPPANDFEGVLIDAPFNFQDVIKEGESPLVMATVPFTMTFPSPGTYHFEILLDGKKVWDVPLKANKI